jgi:GxxExxY protein
MNGKGNRGLTRMNADCEARDAGSRLLYRNTTARVLGIFFDVYNELGGGFLESVYREALAVGLMQAEIPFYREVPLTVWFRKQPVGVFRPDFVIADAVIVECKAVRALDDIYQAQLINYLRATALEVGLLLNFGPSPAFKRLVLENRRKPAFIPGHPRPTRN